MIIRIYPEQFATYCTKKLYSSYFLVGNSEFLFTQGQYYIRKIAQLQQFNEYHHFTLKKGFDWEPLVNLCQTTNLFATRQAITLIFADLADIGSALDKFFMQLAQPQHPDLLFIFQMPHLDKKIQQTGWFKRFSQQSLLLSCYIPKGDSLLKWTNYQAKKLNVLLPEKVLHYLCQRYENNLFAIQQTLSQWQDAGYQAMHKKANFPDFAFFTPIDWIDSIIQLDQQRATHILNVLQHSGLLAATLLTAFYKEIVLLYKLKKILIQNDSIEINKLFDQRAIWPQKREQLKKAAHYFAGSALRYVLTLLTKAEIELKTEGEILIWVKLNYSVCYLFKNKKAP